ncbi:MAG: dihydropteroate synthase [Nitrospirota bacterium]|nr:dihydropteroate synthase [Nitrospirota bacterium]
MLVIADNLNVRNAVWREALKKQDRKAIETLAQELTALGADMISVQTSSDGSGDEDALPFAVEALQHDTALPLCLDSRNLKALRRAVSVTKEPPLINYLSADEKKSDDILRLVRESKSSLVLRALKGTVPVTLEARLLILENLLEQANAADIPNERLYADPSVVHIGGGSGQEHLQHAHESLNALHSLIDPPINTTVWVSNVTAGLPQKTRSLVASSFLTYLAGAGLTAAFLDVRDRELMKAVYLIRTFRDETVFTPADLA